MSGTMLRLARGERFTDPEGPTGGKQGIRGTLSVNGVSWPTIERGKGLMTDYVRLSPGWYRVRMDVWRSERMVKAGVPGVPSLKVVGRYANGPGTKLFAIKPRIHGHPANYPSQLTGCFAAGFTESDRGVNQSRAAWAQIFLALGGYRLGAEFDLEVVNDG